MRQDEPAAPFLALRGSRTRLAAADFILICSLPAVLFTSPVAAQDLTDMEPTCLLEQVQDAFASLAAAVEPTAVMIQAERAPAGPKTETTTSPSGWVSVGSGVIIRSDGAILTNQHVIDGALLIHVTLHDGRRLKAVCLGADARADLAVLRVQANNLPAAELGDAGRLRRGHFVLAFGNPLGLSSDGSAAVNQGVVAAVGRPLPEQLGRAEDRYYGDMIQTTMRVGPGDSGGPLVDVRGRVVGLMTATGAADKCQQGFGLAVPVNSHTKAIVQRLMEGRRIAYGYAGVEVGEVRAFGAQANRAAPDHGVCVDSLVPDGPAARAGLKEGDLLLAVEGRSVRSPDHFVQLVGGMGPGAKVEIQFQRGSARGTAVVELETRPEPVRPEARPVQKVAFRGAVLGEVGPTMRTVINVPDNAMLVVMVAAGSPAHRAGLTPGDVIVRMDGEALRSDATARLAERREDVLLGLANGGSVLVKPN